MCWTPHVYLAGFATTDRNPESHYQFRRALETDTPQIDEHNRMNGFDLNQINPVSGTPGVVVRGVNGFPNRRTATGKYWPARLCLKALARITPWCAVVAFSTPIRSMARYRMNTLIQRSGR
jgi:hypothetical protein